MDYKGGTERGAYPSIIREWPWAMNPEAWAALATVFILGAVSPGPSLALVLRNTLNGGRSQGVLTGIGHGIGFGVYAFSAAAGLATALSIHAAAVGILRWGGIAILIGLGVVFIRHSLAGAKDLDSEEANRPDGRMGFLEGFFVALLNPKILAWILALYAPFVDADMSTRTLLAMGLMGMCIDGTWYVTVAVILSGTGMVDRRRSKAHVIDGAMGLIMLGFAALLVAGVM